MKTISINQFHIQQQQARASRRAFTLIELLVVVSIMLILAAITLTTVNMSMNSDRINMGTRQVQAFLEGARDRSIYAHEPRGVRFIIDQNVSDVSAVNNPKYYCRSMVYIGPPSKFNTGVVSVSTASPQTLFTSFPPQWNGLYQRKLLVSGARIRIFNSSESHRYTIYITEDVGGNIDQVFLTRPYLGSLSTNQNYELQLEPTVLPNQEPRQFARGILIDVPNSDVPPAWRKNHSSYADTKLDIMYAPNGTVFGSSSAIGSVHLLLADIVDIAQSRGPGNPNKEGSERIISITTKTGNVDTHAVHFPQPWSPNQVYQFGQWVHPVGDTSKFFICTQAGTAAASEPAWPGSGTVNDNSVMWEFRSSQDPLYYAETGAGGS